MNDEVKYKVVNEDTLIIESCPSILTRQILDNMNAYKRKFLEVNYKNTHKQLFSRIEAGIGYQ